MAQHTIFPTYLATLHFLLAISYHSGSRYRTNKVKILDEGFSGDVAKEVRMIWFCVLSSRDMTNPCYYGGKLGA
jgi:hypothetical protein